MEETEQYSSQNIRKTKYEIEYMIEYMIEYILFILLLMKLAQLSTELQELL